MRRVTAGITTSVDGYVAGPSDGPGCGLGVGGERLHYWVFGGPWRYEDAARNAPTGEDRAFLEDATARNGAVICGRATYEAAGHWGGANPFGVPLFVVTHRPGEQPGSGGFTFVDGVETAVERATAAAGDRRAFLMGGADVIRQTLHADLVDELVLIVAPVLLGGGKRLFQAPGDARDLVLREVRHSRWATFLTYSLVGADRPADSPPNATR